MNRKIVLLKALSEGIPPKEFRIFEKGWNDTAKGRFLFDEEAAKMVMSSYERDGIDRMVDLEHFSLPDQNDNIKDPDARGWYQLAIRNGELWAINVTWTPDGDRRLRERTQRYISPAFTFDEESGRVTELYNVAICGIPATYDAPALVAASKRGNKKIGTLSLEVKKMDEIKKCAAALGLKEDATLEEVLSAIKALQEPDGDEGDKKAKNADEPTGDDKDKKDDGDKEKMSDEKYLSSLPPKVQARFLAALHSHDDLRKQVADMSAKQKKSEVDGLIAANTDKIPPKLEDWARKQDPEVLREYLKHATPLPRGEREPEREQQGAGEVILTDQEKAVARMTNMDTAKLLEHKKKLAAEQKGHAEHASAERARGMA